MAAGDVRKVFPEDLQMVQNLIENCLLRYMKKNQVMDVLYQRMNVEPTFTKLVWEKLEEENQEFFQAYYLRLLVKDQIHEFNGLLKRQVALSHQFINPHGLVSNGSHIPPMHGHNASYYAPQNNGIAVKPEHMQPAFPAVVHGGYNNGGPYIPSEMQYGPLDMASGRNLNGVAATGTAYHLAIAGPTLESHPPAVSSIGIMDSIPLHRVNGTFMDDTRSSQLLRQFSYDSTQPHQFTNTGTERFFPRVMEIPTNHGFQNSGRDVYNNN